MQLILYYAPVTCALVPYVTLTEAGAPFEVRPLNFGKSQHLAPEYLAVNAKHKVPVLVIDGQPLSENVAIQIWIARNFPAAKLMPSSTMQELQAISLLAWCASGLHPFIFRIFAPQRCCDLPASEQSVRRLAREQLFENYRIADGILTGREFFFDHFTAVDAHFFWCFRRGTQLNLDLAQFGNCMAHFERIKQRPSVQKLLAYESEIQAAFDKAA
ncbi:MAG: glutathione S-transferase family protein [Alphaproteobacteria bacterium]|nr:glutathione S-transferase family protein [Alphaproteobacteria bacterium]MBV9198824.1 glutathione S-transferase family protein [Alphaproteobacteria bacterium]MBV9378792.1 glutathione S-transferase family protein [Alphaproteobacteria bacterium]